MRNKIYIQAVYKPRSVWGSEIEVITNFSPDADMRVVQAVADEIVDSGGYPYTARYTLKSLSVVVEVIDAE